MFKSDGPLVFILSWERPIYLWNCLDSLFRLTKKTVRFVIADNNSQDPLVREVIESFDRRGMFHHVHFYKENDPQRLHKLIQEYKNELGSYFYFIESDISIIDNDICWATEYAKIYNTHKNIAMIGSTCDKVDFTSLKTARAIFPDLDEDNLKFLIKYDSPERHNSPPKFKSSFNPHNPPGRLILLDTAAILKHGIHPDAKLAKLLAKDSYKTCISTKVKHRHLSLLNIYDNPDYDYKSRNQFFADM